MKASGTSSSEHSQDRLAGLEPLIFIAPEALFELLDRQEEAGERLVIEAPDGSQDLPDDAVLPVRMAAADSLEENDYTEVQQDGIILMVSAAVRPGPQRQINVELKKGWFRNKLNAYITGKQQVPGFMGTRDCN